ncbi:MAG: phosphoserine transaminase, partial [Proteobacteria bacterium]|nr:phosphoserine transaminase [Pseudomonadota bacterium]
KQDFIDILNVPSSHEVLFLQGGATHQFSMIPLNFAHNINADYVLSGSWSKKAIAEASKLTKVNTIASSENNGFSYAPAEEDWKYSEDSAYVHYCPNETIQGVAIHEAPDVNNHLIADMSSVILSEPLDVSKFSLIYAGAQKNIGPAGLTMVIIRKDLMELENENLPNILRYSKHSESDSMLNTPPNILRYSKHSESDSMLNTPPTFAWYMAGKVFKWIKQSGGLEFFKEQNHLKASTLYNYIDNSDFYSNPVKIENRSIMNVPFILADNDLDSVFLKESEDNGLLNLKGHRSVGGMRASIYNAMPLEGINELVDFMKVFEAKYG